MVRVTDAPGDVALVGVDEIAPAWRELCRETGAAPFHWPGWYERWARAFTTAPLRVAAAHRGGRLVGVLPLTERRGTLHAPVNGHTPYYGPVLRDARALPLLLDGLLAAGRKGLVLQGVPLTGDQHAAWLAGLSGSSRHRRILPEGVSLTTDVRGSWDGFLASRSANRRQELRRASRRIRRAGDVEVEVQRGDRALAILPDCLALEAAGWKGREGTAILRLPATHRFYAEFAAWAAGSGWLRVTSLRLDGHLAAFSLELEHDGVLYLLKTAYDEDLAPLGPGTALAHALLREGFETAHLHRLEWLGDDANKRGLSNGQVAVHRVLVSPAGMTGVVRHTARLGADRVGEVTRRSLPSGLRARLRATRARRGDRSELALPAATGGTGTRG